MEPKPATPQPNPNPPASNPPEADISKRTIVILVVLSCAISVIGVLAMAYEFSNARAAPVIVQNGGLAGAQAKFSIVDAPPVQEPSISKSTGMATFKVEKRG